MRLWTFIKENKLLSTVISLTVAGVMATPSTIKKYNHSIIAKHQKEIVDSIRASRTDSAIFYISTMRLDISDIKASQEEQAKDMTDIKTSQRKLKDYLETKAASKDDLKEVYRIFDNEKKNVTQSN